MVEIKTVEDNIFNIEVSDLGVGTEEKNFKTGITLRCPFMDNNRCIVSLLFLINIYNYKWLKQAVFRRELTVTTLRDGTLMDLKTEKSFEMLNELHCLTLNSTIEKLNLQLVSSEFFKENIISTRYFPNNEDVILRTKRMIDRCVL